MIQTVVAPLDIHVDPGCKGPVGTDLLSGHLFLLKELAAYEACNRATKAFSLLEFKALGICVGGQIRQEFLCANGSFPSFPPTSSFMTIIFYFDILLFKSAECFAWDNSEQLH